MNRCTHTSTSGTVAPSRRLALARMAFLGLIAASTLALAPLQEARAQSLDRIFPPKALRGKMVVVQPPNITINGEPARLSPGARILSTSNSGLRSSSLVGQELVVNYVRDSRGSVHQVWILNASEVAKKMPGAGTERNFRFASEETSASPSAN